MFMVVQNCKDFSSLHGDGLGVCMLTPLSSKLTCTTAELRYDSEFNARFQFTCPAPDIIKI